jgi:hypothetical protein
MLVSKVRHDRLHRRPLPLLPALPCPPASPPPPRRAIAAQLRGCPRRYCLTRHHATAAVWCSRPSPPQRLSASSMPGTAAAQPTCSRAGYCAARRVQHHSRTGIAQRAKRWAMPVRIPEVQMGCTAEACCYPAPAVAIGSVAQALLSSSLHELCRMPHGGVSLPWLIDAGGWTHADQNGREAVGSSPGCRIISIMRATASH